MEKEKSSDRKAGPAPVSRSAPEAAPKTGKKAALTALLVPIAIGLGCCAVSSAGFPTPGSLLYAAAAAASLALLAEAVSLLLVFLCLLPAIPFAFAATGSFSPLFALPIVLLLLPAALLPARGKATLHRACALSAFLLFLYAAGFFLHRVTASGPVSPETVRAAFPTQAEAVKEAILSIRTLHNGVYYALFSEADAEFYLDSLISVLPALTGGCALILAFLASAAVRAVAGPMKLNREEAEEAFSSRMSPLSAGIFLLSLLLLLLPLPALFFMTAANLFLLLLPGFWLEAFRLLRFLWKTERVRLAALFLTVLFLALIPKRFPLDLLLFGLTGALTVLIGAVLRHRGTKREPEP
ncbi:MAG: hypothetical protein MJ070_05735 [Lachnospiraceae bacterium]|nr:hypothetical protein [Lachnospiraceae bacterium]